MDDKTMVEEHKKMTLLTGNLSDFQLQNLKTWPFLLFDNLEKVKIEYNFTTTDSKNEEILCAGVVNYNFEFKKDCEVPKEIQTKACDRLSFMVKFLFWNDTKVIFKKDGKIWK